MSKWKPSLPRIFYNFYKKIVEKCRCLFLVRNWMEWIGINEGKGKGRAIGCRNQMAKSTKSQHLNRSILQKSMDWPPIDGDDALLPLPFSALLPLPYSIYGFASIFGFGSVDFWALFFVKVLSKLLPMPFILLEFP